MEGREEEALGGPLSANWVGFLGKEEAACRVFLGAAAAPFLGRVGVQAGEGV